jgi:phage I-like protein
MEDIPVFREILVRIPIKLAHFVEHEAKKNLHMFVNQIITEILIDYRKETILKKLRNKHANKN